MEYKTERQTWKGFYTGFPTKARGKEPLFLSFLIVCWIFLIEECVYCTIADQSYYQKANGHYRNN